MSAPKASTTRARRPPPVPDAEGRSPVVEMHGPVEVVFYPGPLPRRDEAPLTNAELHFRWLIAGELVGDRVEVRPEFREWSESVLAKYPTRGGVKQ